MKRDLTSTLYQFECKNSEKSAVAKHLIEKNHNMNVSNIKLIQEINDIHQIEIVEAIHIRKNQHKNLMNEDMRNVQSMLLNIF